MKTLKTSKGLSLLRHRVRADLGIGKGASLHPIKRVSSAGPAVKPQTFVANELGSIERKIMQLLECAPLKDPEAEQVRFQLGRAHQHVEAAALLLARYQAGPKRDALDLCELTSRQKSMLLAISRKSSMSISLIDNELEPLKALALIKVRAARATLTAKGRQVCDQLVPDKPPAKTNKEDLF